MGNANQGCKCQCNNLDSEIKLNQNILQKNLDKINSISEPLDIIDMPNLLKLKQSKLFEYPKKNIVVENHLDINKFLSNNRIERQKKISQIILIQSHFKGMIYRQFFPNIKFSLLEYLQKKLECTKIRFENQSFINIEKIYGKFDPKAWTKYYPISQQCLFEYSPEKFGQIYRCNLLIEKDIEYYTGFVNIDYQKNGYGIAINIYGEKREGNWIRNKLNGWCRYIDSEGNLLEGFFKDNYLNGKGEKLFIDGTLYKGNFKDNLRHGEGNQENDENIYIGNFVDDKKEGKGILKYKNKNDIYEGNFRDNAICGIGKYTWQNQDYYEGEFYSGKMHGKGKYFWADGDEYIGDYVEGLKEGNGMFKWKNGKTYNGHFWKGKPHGKGIFFSENKQFDVEFENGKMIKSSQIK